MNASRILTLLLGLGLLVTTPSCRNAPPPQAQLIELGKGRQLEFWVVPESPAMAKKISLGTPSARVGAAGFVTLQLPIVSGLWPLSYRVDWQDASGMQATDPSASAWRRVNQDSSHPVPIGATSTIANPARATLRLRTDH
jgi:hypothetical protein